MLGNPPARGPARLRFFDARNQLGIMQRIVPVRQGLNVHALKKVVVLDQFEHGRIAPISRRGP